MVLLDTNALLWITQGDQRVGAAARAIIDSRHPIYYSAISVLELMLKKMKGRLTFPDDPTAHLDRGGLRQLPFIGEHAEAMMEFPELIGHDPFDRALIAQAAAEDLTFLTSDRLLLRLGRPWIVDVTT